MSDTDKPQPGKNPDSPVVTDEPATDAPEVDPHDARGECSCSLF